MEKRSSLEAAVQAAVTSPDAKDLAIEYAEAGLDTFLDAGLARDIPFIGTLVGLAKLGISVHDRLFAKKILDLLAGLADLAAEERQELIARLESDPKYGRKVGDHLVDLIDRIESYRKPAMVARVFKAYLRREIDADMLHRLCSAVEHVPGYEVPKLRPFCEAAPQERDIPVVTAQALQGAGLVNAVSGFGALVYEPNEISEAFLRIELDRVGS
jgi:hypothetical protein